MAQGDESPQVFDVDWRTSVIVVAIAVALALAGLVIWWRQAARERIGLVRFLQEQGVDLVCLPGRLRPVANDPRAPERARQRLIGLAIYVASPIDPLPDFIPVIGHFGKLALVPLVLLQVRKSIPPEVWNEHFPPRI